MEAKLVFIYIYFFNDMLKVSEAVGEELEVREEAGRYLVYCGDFGGKSILLGCPMHPAGVGRLQKQIGAAMSCGRKWKLCNTCTTQCAVRVILQRE